MESVVPMSWWNQMLLIFSIISASLCLIIQKWAGLTSLSIYISISWAIFIIIISIWLSCHLLRLTLKATSPLSIEIVNKWVNERILSTLKFKDSKEKDEQKNVYKTETKLLEDANSVQTYKRKSKGDINQIRKSGKKTHHKSVLSKAKRVIKPNDIAKEINVKCIEIWYQYISDDKSFPAEAQEMLRKLLTRLFSKIDLIDKVKLTKKIATVLLLHLKEYHRALRRVEKGTAKNVEEAYKCLHLCSRNTAALEHMLDRLVAVLAQEFLQWELTSSLPCKLLLSILAKKLFLTIETISCPSWIFESLLCFVQPVPKEPIDVQTQESVENSSAKANISEALNHGIESVTAAAFPRSLPKPAPDISVSPPSEYNDIPLVTNIKRPSLHLENLPTEYRGLWGESVTEVDSEMDEDRISPVYEEPTDFATTIARLRSVLQQKSTVTTPLHMEEKSYVMYDGSQFTNLSIPWTEFHTAPDGSQQLLYCIQFDDVEQRGVDLFETTTATVRRQYSDFAQLHASLEEIPALAPIMSDLILPEGGRVELESYLKTLCTRLANECPTQLRHFLRPSSSAGKKADAVAPRFDRFLAKTVTGVFNTLKTVVPGFEIDQEEEPMPLPTLMPLADIPWRFVEDIKSRSLMVQLQQLIAERTDYCSVDTAYEAVDSIEGNDDSESLAHWWDIVNTSHDEVDELDSSLPLTCIMLDLICEVLQGIKSNNTLQQEVVVRWTKFLLGNFTESFLQKLILWMSEHLDSLSLPHGVQTEDSTESTMHPKDKLYEILQTQIPSHIKSIFGTDETEKILQHLLSCWEIKKINMDFSLQILDVLASELLISCRMNHENSTFQ